ncbi:methylated-DNA--[protein]-cysteine S-methyltransferase (plasmid) [Azospirillum oryzae]|uniref:Methylated-DNA--protein-cysteine methyltransferase n=1 Tax=Azospirillum oryzae TaxID=286727 RepID=A0A6N1AEX0_9PROT|nr:methylated-DNA--[protein]-cysteine S-methyltransferase [Azospirillum oryzae]KAA0585579.1 methylated-DNA--[protein]-cysteine S-methyltransferase [Azospirillum oryzae]QKS50271.1 methylated-DNA--[protein]-cysteine S-methyltransferase [Azospirillum oryzae]GLR80847.1 methylated-DNA--protein-cysteine methyltransferase [Azospirillum oryzae]
MSAPSSLLIDRTATPIGELIVVADTDGALRAIDWTDHEDRLQRLLRLHHPGGYELWPSADPGGLTRAMDAYFAGELAAIDRLAVRTGGTPFQRAVWSALRGIPCGRTVSYRELATLVGRPAAVRAAGHANGANPISVVVPCHRVIGSDGTLTGYGGGVERKRWLLTHEGASCPDRPPRSS